MMLSTISQINTKPYYMSRRTAISFKNSSYSSVEKSDSFKKEEFPQVEQADAKRVQKYLLLTALMPIVLGVGVAIFRHKGDGTGIIVKSGLYEFESLQNDSKVPTLDTCKSINKDLKKMLRYQVKLHNADKSILEDVGKPDVANRFLLSGSPGVGKTHFSKIYAKTLNADYLEILFSDLNSKWAGEVEGKMTSMFRKIIKQAKNNPQKEFVVTFNEIDSILLPAEHLTGEGGSTHFATLRRQRSTFLTYIDKLQEEAPNVTVIGTTNLSPKSKNLDGAAMSRFQNVMEVPYPDKECLYEAIKLNIEKVKGKEKFISENDDKLRDIAKTMNERKFSFRNLEYAVNSAKTAYLEEKLENSNAEFKFEYLEKAVKGIQCSDGEREIANVSNLPNKKNPK